MPNVDITDGQRAIELISTGKISKVKGKENDGFYYVKGTQDEYLVILPAFCTCEHFILKCLNKPGNVCYHILAAQMAGEIKKVYDKNWIELLLKEHV